MSYVLVTRGNLKIRLSTSCYQTSSSISLLLGGLELWSRFCLKSEFSLLSQKAQIIRALDRKELPSYLAWLELHKRKVRPEIAGKAPPRDLQRLQVRGINLILIRGALHTQRHRRVFEVSTVSTFTVHSTRSYRSGGISSAEQQSNSNRHREPIHTLSSGNLT